MRGPEQVEFILSQIYSLLNFFLGLADLLYIQKSTLPYFY